MLTILFICFLIRIFGKKNVEKAMYRIYLIDKKDNTVLNKDEQLHKMAESLTKNKIKK